MSHICGALEGAVRLMCDPAQAAEDVGGGAANGYY